MDVTYYPGCSLEASARNYDESIKAVCKALDIHLHELPDWTCCGATSAHCLNEELAGSLPALNLSRAEQLGNDMVVPCPLCFNRLQRSRQTDNSTINIYLKFHRFVITKTCSSYESEIIFAGFALHIANSHKINSRRRYPLTNKIYDFSMGYVMQ